METQEMQRNILHILRQTAQTGRPIAPELAAYIHRESASVKALTPEQMTAELLPLLCGAYVGKIMLEYCDVFGELLPELVPMFGFKQHNPYHKYDVWEHSVRAVESIRPEPLLRLVMLFHDSGKPCTFTIDEKGVGHFYGHPVQSQSITERALQHLSLPKHLEQKVLYLVRHHDTPLGSNLQNVRRKLAVHGEEMFRYLLIVKKADCIGQGTTPKNMTELLKTEALLEQVLQEKHCVKRQDLAVNGRELQEWGIHEQQIGRYMSELMNHVLDDPSCNTKEKLYQIFLQLRQEQNSMEMTVNGMSAGYCVRQVRQLLETVPSVEKAEIALDSGRVKLFGQKIPLEQVRTMLTAAGYEVAI